MRLSEILCGLARQRLTTFGESAAASLSSVTGKKPPVVVAAIAREVAAFPWAIGQEVAPRDSAGGRTQHLCNLPIAKAAVPAGQLNDVGGARRARRSAT
jgi:hypothetical protein